MEKRITLLAMFMLMFIVFACGNASESIVTISETENFLNGTIKSEDGVAIDSAVIVLYKSSSALTKSIALNSYDEIIDSVLSINGSFGFSLSTEGYYSIKAFKNDSIISEKDHFMFTKGMTVGLIVGIVVIDDDSLDIDSLEVDSLDIDSVYIDTLVIDSPAILVDHSKLIVQQDTLFLERQLIVGASISKMIYYAAYDSAGDRVDDQVVIEEDVDFAMSGVYDVKLTYFYLEKYVYVSVLDSAAYEAKMSRTLVLDNFENSLEYAGDGVNNYNFQTDIGAMLNTKSSREAGLWYAYNDGASTATPDYISDDQFSSLEADGYNGSCLHVSIELTDNTSAADYPFYGIGCLMKGEGEFVDFSDLEEISFYAKGSGDMELHFITEETMKYEWGDMYTKFSLTEEWTKYTIAAAEFIAYEFSPVDDAGLTWDNVKGAVGKMHFQTALATSDSETNSPGETIDFWVDEIMLRGVQRNTFFDNFGVDL